MDFITYVEVKYMTITKDRWKYFRVRFLNICVLIYYLKKNHNKLKMYIISPRNSHFEKRVYLLSQW